MNDENNFGVPVLDEIEYSVPETKKGGPTGVSAPVLDDMDSYVPKNTPKKGAPTDVSAPVLDDDTYSYRSAPKRPVYISDEEIISGLTPDQKTMFDNLPPDKQKQVLDMRREQLGALSAPVTAPVLDDENSYVPPVKKTEPTPAAPVTAPILDDENSYVPPVKKADPTPAAPVTAPILDDEPEPTKYVSKFADEELERVKAEAKKKAVSSQLTSNQKDEKESLRMMLELKAEREAEAAKKGFFTVIILAVVGVAAAILFWLVYSGGIGGIDYIDKGGFSSFMKNNCFIVAALAGILSLAMVPGISVLKSICSLFYLIFSIIQVVGIFSVMPQLSGGGLKWALCIGALVCSAAVLFVPGSSENIGLYYKKPKNNYDH